MNANLSAKTLSKSKDTTKRPLHRLSLRRSEVTLLCEHYERMAMELEISATFHQGPKMYEQLKRAGMWQTRATEIRKQGNEKGHGH